MTPTSQDRHRDKVVNEIIETARGFRYTRQLDFDAPVYLTIPDGVRSDLTRADIEQLAFMGIYEKKD